MKIGAPEPIAALNRIKIVETGEPLVDIREYCAGVEVREEACPYLRVTVADRLNHAQRALPQGMRFRVGTALRTMSMQKRGWDNYHQQMRELHPEWPLSALRRATNRFFAPYDQPAPPGHCTGGAVDVSLLGPDGQPLDVTSPLQGWAAAYTWTDRISPEAKRNRMILVKAMLSTGFSNCREEYWHYSWGDSAWAVRVGETTCPYGRVEAPPVVESGHTGGTARNLRITGPGCWSCAPVEGKVDVGIFWHEGRPVELTVVDSDVDSLYLSVDRKEWHPLPIRRAAGAVVVELTPGAPRVFVRSEPPST